MTDSYGVTKEELRQFIERVESARAEIEEKKEFEREIFAEAKARGYDTKVMRKVIARRRRDKNDLAEEDAILENYKAALGMS